MTRWVLILFLSAWGFYSPCAYAQLFERDTSFLPAWKQTLNYPYIPGSVIDNIVLLNDGRIVFGGGVEAGVLQGFPRHRYKYLVRLFPDGTIDPTLSDNFGLSSGVVKFENNLYSMGPFDAMRIAVADSSGTYIPNYIPDSIQNTYSGSCYNYHFYPDGKILWTSRVRSTRNLFPGWKTIIRTFANGTWDSSFNHACDQPLTRIFPLKSGKLLLYTPFGSSYDGHPVGRLFQIDTAGNLDTNFRTNFPNGELKPLYEDSLGRIYIGGHSMTNPANVLDTSFLVRLMPNGDYDTTFNNFGTYGNLPSAAETLIEGPSGRLLIGGFILKYQGHTVNHFVITDANGNFDSLAMQGITGADIFDPQRGIGSNFISDIEKEQSGSYLVAGRFNGFNGQPAQMVVRLWPRFPVGVQEVAAWEVNVYPVPARVGEQVWLRLPQLPAGEQLLVYDAQGRLVQKQILPSTNPSIQLPKSGLYFLQIQNPNGVAHWRGKVVVVE